MTIDLERIKLVAEHWKAEEVLAWAFATYGDNVELATGLGVEGMALLDIAHRINPKLKVFTGDTEFLFPETYDLIDRVEAKYGIKIERLYSDLTPEDQERLYGKALWERDPDQCCNLRKVEPIRKVDWDAKFNLVKISPLADWRRESVWRYVIKHNVPYNPLHDRNYPSIGCTHCTRAVLPGEDARAGRWSGFRKTECGLHTAAQPSVELVQLTATVEGD